MAVKGVVDCWYFFCWFCWLLIFFQKVEDNLGCWDLGPKARIENSLLKNKFLLWRKKGFANLKTVWFQKVRSKILKGLAGELINFMFCQNSWVGKLAVGHACPLLFWAWMNELQFYSHQKLCFRISNFHFKFGKLYCYH